MVQTPGPPHENINRSKKLASGKHKLLSPEHQWQRTKRRNMVT